MAVKRLMQEFKELVSNPTEGVVAGPAGEDSFFEWEAMVLGPGDTPFADGCFSARLTFPPDYPLNPPKMRFTTPLFHPNVYKNGEVCISILHPPGDDKFGYEKSSERWSPVQSVEKILMSVISMLAEPNADSPANVDAAKMWRDDRGSFAHIAELNVRASLGLDVARDGSLLLLAGAGPGGAGGGEDGAAGGGGGGGHR